PSRSLPGLETKAVDCSAPVLPASRFHPIGVVACLLTSERQRFNRGDHPMVNRKTFQVLRSLTLLVLCSLALQAQVTDVTPPSSPTGLTAAVATCGQVDLSWNASTDEVGGSGLKAYNISRSDGYYIAIGSVRTTFSDTNLVKSSTTLTYYVSAQDNAGNVSLPSNYVTVVTPPCAMSLGEQVVDSAYLEPLGKSMATYGYRRVLLYWKQNSVNLTRDTWLYVNDS